MPQAFVLDYGRGDDADSAYRQLVLLSLVTVGFGVTLLAWPHATVRVLAVLLGLWFLLAGVARVVTAFFSRRGPAQQLLSGAVGLIFIIGGAACLRDVAKGIAVLALLVGLAWIFSGLAEFVVATRASGANRSWLTALATVSVLVGLVFLLWPAPSMTVLVALTGLSALVVGVTELAFAYRLHHPVAD